MHTTTSPMSSNAQQPRARAGRSLFAGPMAVAALLCLPPAAWAADAVPVEKVVVKSVARFGFDGTSMTDADRDAMLAEVGKLKDVTWQTVTATGHTDNVGRAAYNQRLSARRAAAVKAYLVSNGLAPSMIQARGLADKQPVASNADADGRAQNRRAEVEFQGVRVSSK